ncbi:hypothetical protein BZG36_00341 [Bifiguratus adelaidae]|uniref:Nucleotide-diphospho-sugar transferase n=1 Tax=Bifiguratus adelaidae TaxID=1938954 RepID=A0A261Y7Z3_9FUNG|nr:hypothetical protein BZG36_00341 [Bifiguratus adelaidae]
MQTLLSRLAHPLEITLVILCTYLFFSWTHGSGKPNPTYNSAFIDSAVACHGTSGCNGTAETPGNHSYAFFSALWNAEYLQPALVLGYSIRKYHPDIPLYLLVKPDSDLRKDMFCQLETVGWTIKEETRVDAPIDQVKKQFRDNFTKLKLWSYTQFDAIVYLDADTLVRDRVDDLFTLVDKDSYPNDGFEFAAALDNYGQWSLDFNAGIMVLRPNHAVYQEMLRLLPQTDNYNVKWAEQGFLNEYFRFRFLHLPEQYNFNLAFVSRHRQTFRRLKPDLKIIHFTISKPWRMLRIEFEASAIWTHASEEMKRSVSFRRCGNGLVKDH